MFLSNSGRAHTLLTIDSIYFPLFKGALRPEGIIKVGNLSRTVLLSKKEELGTMPICYHTPPEILNFILFEAN
jgi:hypothetical protein